MINNSSQYLSLNKSYKSRNKAIRKNSFIKENFDKFKENRRNPKLDIKIKVRLEPSKEISKFGVEKENRNEVNLKKNLLIGNFFFDNNNYLSQGIECVDLNFDQDDEKCNLNSNSIKSSYSSVKNIKSNYSTTRF